MTFKSPLWRGIAVGVSVFNVGWLGYAAALGEPLHAAVHGALAAVFGFWALRLERDPRSRGSGVEQRLQQQAAALQDARTTLEQHSSRIEELEERVDFAERLLAQTRERVPLDGRREDA